MQVDAPQDPSAFVHRVGRTARAGRSGAALLYLSPHEAPYVDFLKLRNVGCGRGGRGVGLKPASPGCAWRSGGPLRRCEAEWSLLAWPMRKKLCSGGLTCSLSIALCLLP